MQVVIQNDFSGIWWTGAADSFNMDKYSECITCGAAAGDNCIIRQAVPSLGDNVPAVYAGIKAQAARHIAIVDCLDGGDHFDGKRSFYFEGARVMTTSRGSAMFDRAATAAEIAGLRYAISRGFAKVTDFHGRELHRANGRNIPA